MEDLTVQNQAFENIKTIHTNYKKDSASRKTQDYLTKRLVSLEAQWADFYERHQKLKTIEDKEIQYFREGIYEKTKLMYEETRADILRLLSRASSSTILEGTPTTSKEHDQKALITKNENYIELQEQQECNFNAIDRAMSKINFATITEKWELEDHLSILKSKWEAIDKIHWQIERVLKGTDTQYSERYVIIESRYDELKRKINSKLWTNAHYHESTPRIELPEFDGNYNKWIPFKDIFLDIIHNNPTISKAQKIKHLKTKLKGEAEKIVQHLTISADNYDACWSILEQRYDNRRLLFTSYMNTLMNLPTIQANSPDIKKMHDVIIECINALHNLGIETSSCESIIVYLMTQKFDTLTFNEYIKELRDPRELPRLDDFTFFLENKFTAYESVKNRQREAYSSSSKPTAVHKKPFPNNKFSNFRRESPRTYHIGPLHARCPLCDENHVLMQCTKFTDMNSFQRNSIVTKLRVCRNCLFSHGEQNCTSTKTCKECNRRHHTLLHNSDCNKSMPNNYKNNSGQRPTTSTITKQPATNHVFNEDEEVLLTTVLLKIKTVDGTQLTLRALLDQGSQVNIITENAAQLLRLPRKKMNAILHGVGTVKGDCKGRLSLECQSIYSSHTFNIEALIMKKMINNLPNTTFEKKSWSHIENLKLADPEFNVSRPVDLLLGADVYAEIIMDGVLKGDASSPTAQQTLLGWILCGKLKTYNCHITTININELTHFWETEDILQQSDDITKDEYCEQYYQKTTTRAKDGKYIVKMPMIEHYEQKLGNSKSRAIAQYLQLERKLVRNNKLALMYKEFIEEYKDLQHLTTAKPTSGLQCFLPHHGVLREHATTTKLRVVFNASQKTSSGFSLNDVMERGPNLQKDIQTLLIQWRAYKFVFTADIEKFYRCIWLSEDQQPLQKIIWRDSPNSSLSELQLRTITYGTKCAPWLAMRTLKQLALDDGPKYPEAAHVLNNHLYCDDLLSGHNNHETAKSIQIALIKILQGAGMNLRKWSSNDPSLLQHLPPSQVVTNETVDFKTETNRKTLGLGWNPNIDCFLFNWQFEEQTNECLTKRQLLTEISKLYDPMGWLAPVTVTAKLLFQRVWLTKLSWDDTLAKDIQTEWQKLKAELPILNDVQLKRWIGSTNNNIQLHGYCDASEKAYACVIYCVTKTDNNIPNVTLLTAKTRVVPTSQKITLPRLELCGALLLSKLMEKVKETFKDYSLTIFAWSDSQVALAWIQGETTKREVYVANRVAKIRKIIEPRQWQYIKSEMNPADCASRGLSPHKLINFKLWWNGPEQLINTKITKTNQELRCTFTTNLETIQQSCTTLTNQNKENVIDTFLNRYSSFTHILRRMTWIIRFITYLRNKALPDTINLTANELNDTAELITKRIQIASFKNEYDLLKQNKPLTKASKLYKLNPYIDEKGILRVGGRLENSALPFNMKHPAILPHKQRLTELIIDDAHLRTLHGGARLTLAIIREQYWIVGGNRAVKARLTQCVRCHRYKPTKNYQLMGDLPQCRVTPSRPFTHTGIDYTGHVEVKLNKGRGIRTSKGYIVIFICMATKAVHIELASDMSTETFILAFQRMCSRRGTPKHIYTDCGTNFVGASKVLRNDFESFRKAMPADFFEEIYKLQVQWHFNAPAWPSAGGLWEAAVKSMKYHLRRVLGEQKLTYEEFTTLLTKIEACMNSRPLCQLTEDPEEFYNFLTPAHFLTGSSNLLLPQTTDRENFITSNINLRKRWQLLENMWQQYWKRWSGEYLTQLQARAKWQKPTNNIKKGDIVLIRDDNLPPGKWAMGRIMELHPGRDGFVRVTTIKTKNGVIKRPIVKVSILPIQVNDDVVPESNLRTESPVKQERSRSNKRRGVKKCFSLLFTALMTWMMVPPTQGVQLAEKESIASTQITRIEPGRPAYYDTLGKIELLHDEWTLLVYYNLTTYWEAAEHLQNYLNVLKSTCDILDPRFCKSTLNQLYNEITILNYYNTILLTPHKHLTRRKKRGLINGVGYIASDLFGILDSRFAEKYERDINSLQQNENYLLELSKNQTSIIAIENEVLRKTEINIQTEFGNINNYLQEINASLANIETGIELSMAANYFSSSALTTYLLTNNLKNIQEMLLKTLTDSYKGHIDIHLLSPANLLKKIREISAKLPKALTVPLYNDEDIKDLYKLMYMKSRVTEKYLLCEIQIPLISDEDYTLYKVYPLPLLTKNNKSQWTVISSSHVAINFKKSAYVALHDRDLEQCLRRNNDTYVCGVNLPVYNLHHDKAPCEIKLLGQALTLPCKTKTYDCKDKWMQLNTPNMWLLVCCEQCVIRLVCDNNVASYTTNTSALVTLQQGCILQANEMTIFAHNNYHSKLNMSPEIIAPSLDNNINHMVKLTLNEVTNSITPIGAQIEEIEQNISQQREKQQRLPNEITTNDIHQYVLGYTTLSIVLAAGAVWIAVTCYRRRRSPEVKDQESGKLSRPQEDIELQPHYALPTTRRSSRGSQRRNDVVFNLS